MMYLSDLPTGALAHVSSFLAAPSRALFAVALNSRESSSAIAGDDWEYLDFGHIEKDLAAKLIDDDIRDIIVAYQLCQYYLEKDLDLAAKISDDDIRGVLLSIDAVNNLKKLRLTNCINISGAGLEPLRGSTIIQQIDLSLVGDHESPRLDPEPPISCAEVIPILDSIIERGEECSLEYLQFPNEWRKERNTESDFHAFLTRYNELLCSRAVVCLKCNHDMFEVYSMPTMMEMSDSRYGTQNFTCYNCMDHYCEYCADDGGVYYIGGSCKKCERIYCLHCKKVDVCGPCGSWYCADCIDFKQCPKCDGNTCPDCFSECSRCHENTCSDCVSGASCHNTCCADKISCNHCAENGDAFRWCDRCSVDYCVDCCDSDIYAVKFCDVCEDTLCGQCRVKKCMEWRNCARCYHFSFPALLEDKERTQTKNNEMENENKEQRNEINELKRKVKDLTGELEEV
ncbi:hypothetical protein QTG54_014364 [Skeletonema marinoi]|uniref:Uncharacterized protein n=1 Tax=Skeletonema marinoi TaxID=267567 RepID=A0AAD8XW15_9STRA|nr:hypothetical protein QTG54_014364 [Skeletonema marinoi]